MRVRVVRDTVADGRVVLAGEVLSLPGEDAAALLRMGKAVAHEDSTDAPVVPVVAGKPAAKRSR
jgi:hypothetical protein